MTSSSQKSKSSGEDLQEDVALRSPAASLHSKSAVDLHDAEKHRATTAAAIAPTSLEPADGAAVEVVDGGARAWLQVVGSFLVFANLWGPSFAFGSFQSFYHLTYIPNDSASDISWIGTVAIFLLIFGGVVSGPLFDMGYFRSMLVVGALVETVAMFLMSLCRTYWQLFLTQAVMMGLGNGLLYIPGLSLVGRSFNKRRSIAMSITTCGAPMGGIVYTLMFEQLIPRIGFAGTVRAMGYYMLGTYCISFPLSLWGVKNLGTLGTKDGAKRKLFDVKALKDVPFLLFSGSQFLIFLGYLTPFVYLPTYGQVQLGLSQSFSFIMIVVAQAASIFGRMVAGYSATRLGVMLPWTVSALASGILCLAWIGAMAKGGYIAIAVLYGGFSGALIPLPPSIFPRVCPDPRVLGTWLGMTQGFCAFASLLGAPIGGALIGVAGEGAKRFLGLQVFCGLAMCLGSGGLICLWTLLVRRRGTGKLI